MFLRGFGNGAIFLHFEGLVGLEPLPPLRAVVIPKMEEVDHQKISSWLSATIKGIQLLLMFLDALFAYFVDDADSLVVIGSPQAGPGVSESVAPPRVVRILKYLIQHSLQGLRIKPASSL